MTRLRRSARNGRWIGVSTFKGEAHSYVFIHSVLIAEDGGYGLVDKEEKENKDLLEEMVLHELVNVHIFANNIEDNDDHGDHFKKVLSKL